MESRSLRDLSAMVKGREVVGSGQQLVYVLATVNIAKHYLAARHST